MLGAAAEFERALIRERAQADQARYKQDFESGKVGRTVYSRSGRNLPPHRPRRVFDRDEVLRLRRQGWSYRQIAKSLGLGLGTSGRCSRVPKARSGHSEQRRRPGTIAFEWRHPLTISKHYATIIF